VLVLNVFVGFVCVCVKCFFEICVKWFCEMCAFVLNVSVRCVCLC